MSGVQSAIALEALVSAAFILISSKVGDLIGRKRAYVLGLLAYAIGALAMTLAQDLRAIIIFWAILGGLGASMLLPAMQSLIHGNFDGAARKKTYALVGAAAAIAAAVGPLLGGFVTTYLSWRVGFFLEVVVIAVVLANIKLVRDVAYTGPRQIDLVGAALSVVGMGGVVLGILVWQEGGEAVAALIVSGAIGLVALAFWLVRRKRQGKPTLLDPGLFSFPHFRIGISQQMLQQITLGGAMIVLPIFLQMTLEYNAMQAGLSLAPLSLSMFAVAMIAGRKVGEASLEQRRTCRVRAHHGGNGGDHPARPSSGLRLAAHRSAAARRFRVGPAGLPAQQLHAGTHRGGAGQRGSRRQLGRRVLRALLRVWRWQEDSCWPPSPMSFTDQTEASKIIPADDQEQIAQTLEDDAQIMSNTQIDELLADEPEDDPGRDPPHQLARTRPLAPDRAARLRPRQPHRPDQLVPHDAPAGDHAVSLSRGNGPGLSPGPANKPPTEPTHRPKGRIP